MGITEKAAKLSVANRVEQPTLVNLGYLDIKCVCAVICDETRFYIPFDGFWQVLL